MIHKKSPKFWVVATKNEAAQACFASKKTSGPLQVDDQETDGFCLQIAFAPYTHPLRMYTALKYCQNSAK